MSKLPTLRPSLLDYLTEQKRNAKRQANSSAFNRSGVTVTPDGLSIPNDVLVSPIVPDAFSSAVTNFGLSAGLNTLTSVTLIVPTGFTGAVVLGTSRVFAYNNESLGDYVTSRLYMPLSTTPVATATLILNNGDSGTNHAPNSAVLTGLAAGDPVVLQLQAGTSTITIVADSQNVASIDGVVLWTR